MKFRNNQSGFSHVVIILVVLVVGLIGAVGWLVYDKQNSKESTATDEAQTTTTYQKEDPNSPEYVNEQKYLEITEWGVKIPLNTDLADAYYAYKQDGNTVYLSKEAYKGTGCAADATTLGAIGRFAVADKNSEENAPLVAGSLERKGYYYYYAHPQASCSDDNAINQQASGYMSQFKAAVDKISD